MKILSIDTASDVCGVSILEDNNLICNLDSNTGRTHSENLMPMIQNALNQSSILLKAIDLIICDKGPGSFTGIRIGIATVKAFHDSLNINCVCVSSLEALAYNIKESGIICSLIDCKNNNCYYALYNLEGNQYTELIKPSTASIENVLDCLKSYNERIIFVGDGAVNYKNIIIDNFDLCLFADDDKNILNSYSLGLAGLNRYNNGIDGIWCLRSCRPIPYKYDI